MDVSHLLQPSMHSEMAVLFVAFCCFLCQVAAEAYSHSEVESDEKAAD